MRPAIRNAVNLLGQAETEAMRQRLRSSRSARIAAISLSLRTSDDELADFCREFAKLLGSKPASILPYEFNPEDHICTETLDDGCIIAVPDVMARQMYADRLLEV